MRSVAAAICIALFQIAPSTASPNCAVGVSAIGACQFAAPEKVKAPQHLRRKAVEVRR